MRPDQNQRYQRQILLKEIGGAGQRKLLNAKVLLVGAGGLAAGCLPWLASAGVGRIGVMDDDVVELSNLQRQTLFATEDVGRKKVEALAPRLAALNPDCRWQFYDERLTPANALARIKACDIIADGSDNFATRFLLNDAAYFARRVLVSAALAPLQGQLTTLKAFARDARGTPWPCYRSLVPDMEDDAASAPAPCAGLAMPSALAGVMGALMAMEILKEIVGFGTSLVGRLLLYDAASGTSRVIRIPWDPANPLNGKAARWRDLSHHKQPAARPAAP